MKTSKAREAEVKELLKDLCKPGTKVYCNLRHVSKSRMFRVISLHVTTEDGIRDISYPAAALLEGYSEKHQGCKASGCGMDMGFHLVHNLSYALHGKGFECIGKGCPSNEHSNGDRNYDPHMHTSGGYSLHHEWI